MTSSLIPIAVIFYFMFLPGDGKVDYATFHFRCDISEYDAAYLENREAVVSLEQILREAGTERVESIDVVAYASPEGRLERNLELSRKRAEALAPLVETYLPDYAHLITVEAGGEAWEPLRLRIERDTLITEASRNKILRILDDDSVGVDTRKWRLANRLGQDPVVGDLYRYLLDKHYAYLRCLFITIRYKEEPEPVVPEPEPEPVPEPEPEPEPVPVPEEPEPEPVEPEPEPIPEPEPEPVPEPVDTTLIHPILAVSTNLLYDLLITPNVAVELPLGQHWSVLADYTFPWWVNRANDRAWEILKLDLGARYWLGSRDDNDPMDILKGHFFGIDLGAGYYDIEPHHTGWQGEFLTAGLEYGYAWRLGDNWRIEAFLAGGWMGTNYRYYEGNEGDTRLIYKDTYRMPWYFGPTKLGCSIKYIFTSKRRRAEK